MNSLILYETDRINDLNFEITDPLRVKHLNEVLKVTPNKELSITLLNQGLGTGIITNADKQKVCLKISNLNRPDLPKIRLYVGVSRPPTIKKVLEHGTSLGVSEFIFFKADLSEKSYLDSKIFDESGLNQIIDLGLSQSAIYFQRPSVELLQYFPEQEMNKKNNLFYLDPYADHFVGQEIFSNENEYNFLIGPERGFTDREITLFKSHGIKGIKIHRSVLRVEIATFAILSQLEQSISR